MADTISLSQARPHSILLALSFRAEHMPADAAIRYVAGMSVDDLNRQVQMPKREWMAAGAMAQAPKIGALVQKKTCPQSKGFSFMWHCPHKWKVVVEGGNLRTTKASLIKQEPMDEIIKNLISLRLNQIGTNGRDHQKPCLSASLIKLEPMDEIIKNPMSLRNVAH